MTTAKQHRRHKARNINGILLLDKPVGITSNCALQQVKQLFSARKAGHTGSLDPLASGMLPLCFGEATKFSQFLLDADKSYCVTAKLGISTTTGDAEGDVVETLPIGIIDEEKLQSVLQQFRGDIEQIPSMYSALKHQGQPLYKLARQGITVPRKARTVHISKLELLEKTDDTIKLEVDCSKGTYIRTLVEDIGKALGCGAHVIELRRSAVSGYNSQQMITMEDIEKYVNLKKQDSDETFTDYAQLDKYLLPVETAVMSWSAIQVSETMAFYLRQGQPVQVSQPPIGKQVRLYLSDTRFLGVGEVLEDGLVAPKRLVQNKSA